MNGELIREIILWSIMGLFVIGTIVALILLFRKWAREEKEADIITLFIDEPDEKEKENLERNGHKKVTVYMKRGKN